MRYPSALVRLIRELGKLPGVGPKSAQRLAFHLFDTPPESARELAEAILEARANLRLCKTCGNVTDREICAVCDDPGREHNRICVVGEPGDLLAIERSGEYHGVYHVLHGNLSPMNGIGPDQLRLPGLLERVGAGGIEEVILATSTTVEGEATAMYVARSLQASGVQVTRIAYGLPAGGELEYADDITLGRAIANRRAV